LGLDAANYNSYSPTLTGGNASGTWGINITGNAGTATKVTRKEVAGYLWDGTNLSIYWTKIGRVSSDASMMVSIYGSTDSNYSGAQLALATFKSFSGGSVSAQLDSLTANSLNANIAIDNSGDCWIYVSASWSSFVRYSIDEQYNCTIYSSPTQQITTPANSKVLGPGQGVRATSGNVTGASVYNTGSIVGDLTVRGSVSIASNTALHAGNYNSYSPTLTGTGASGTWGINITGNAATATSATDSTKLPLAGGTMTGSLVNNQDGGVIIESNASEYNNWLWKENAKQWGIFWFNKGSQAGQTIGTYTTIGAEAFFMGGVSSGPAMPTGWTGYQSGSYISAMISNYTGYIYSASTVYAATSMLVGGNTVLHANNYSSYALPLSGGTVNGQGLFRRNQTAGDYTTAALWTESYGNTTTGIAFHISGVAGRYLEMRNNSSELFWQSAIILNSGNYSSYALPLSGGTVTNVTLGARVNGTTYGGNTTGMTGHSFPVEIRANAAKPTLTWHYESVATRHIALDADGALNVYNPGEAGGAVFKVGGNVALHAGNVGTYAHTISTNPSTAGPGTLAIGNNGSYSFVQSHAGQPLNLNPVGNPVNIAGNTAIHAGNYSSYALPLSGGNLSSNLSIAPVPSSWGEGLSFIMPTTSTWGGLRWRRERAGADGNWYIGFTALDSSDDLVFGANNGGSQIDNILRLTKAGVVTNNGNQILHAGNYTSYAWERSGGWKPASLSGTTRQVGIASPDGGEFAISYSGGQTYAYVDGWFYQNEGQYRVLDTQNYSSYALPLSGGTVTGNTTIGRDLYISGQAGGAFGNRLIVGNTGTSYTLQDTNQRPTIQIHGAYPVLSLNHTITSNGNHGPTIQFTNNGVGSQFVIGTNGTGTQLDMGYSSDSTWNPHNGIAGYLGTTFFRATTGGAIGLGALGDWGALGSGDPEYNLHFKGANNGTGGFAAVFQNIANAVTGGGFLFQNDFGNHSYGIVAEFRVGNSGSSDRPSILFSSALTSTSWSVGYGAADDQFRINQNHGHRAASWGTERFRIDTGGTAHFNGNVAIHAGNYTNYTDPRYPRKDVYSSVNNGFEVYRNIGTISGSWQDDQHTLSLQNGDAGNIVLNWHRGGYTSHNMRYNGSDIYFDLAISSAGNITAYSDERLKKDWAALPADFITRLATVKSGTYTRIDSGERQAGSSAQDWQLLLPEVVTKTGNDDTLALAYGNAALVSAVELAKEVIDLRAQVTELRTLIITLINKDLS
jgi:hypothetical protein